MFQLGQEMNLPVGMQEENDGRKKTRKKIYAVGTCVYIHPKNRFALFDFGNFRQCFTENDILDRSS